MTTLAPQLEAPSDPRAADPNWPWRCVRETAYVVIPCWVCGRQGEKDRPEAVVRVAGEGIEQRGGVRFAVPFTRLGVMVPARVFGGPYGIGMGEGTMALFGRDANELRERVRSGWTGIEGPKPFVPRVPTAEDLACEAGRYGMRKRQFLRTGTWGGDAGAKL